MLVHLNGRLVDAKEAKISVFDRGFLFGDGVYEGLRTTESHAGPIVIGAEHHTRRLGDGLAEARIMGFDPAMLVPLVRELVAANGLVEAFIYWQVTRGTPSGDAGPARPRIARGGFPPTVVGFATPVAAIKDCRTPDVRRIALRPDTRWMRGHLKSISLLGGVLAAYEADEAGAEDAVMVRDGLVTEGTATNLFACIDGRLVTPSLESAPMLAGVTRRLILQADPAIEERAVKVEELHRATELMLVGTKTMVSAVSHIDGRPVSAASAPGPVAHRLLEILHRGIRADLDAQAGAIGASKGSASV